MNYAKWKKELATAIDKRDRLFDEAVVRHRPKELGGNIEFVAIPNADGTVAFNFYDYERGGHLDYQHDHVIKAYVAFRQRYQLWMRGLLDELPKEW